MAAAFPEDSDSESDTESEEEDTLVESFDSDEEDATSSDATSSDATSSDATSSDDDEETLVPADSDDELDQKEVDQRPMTLEKEYALFREDLLAGYAYGPTIKGRELYRKLLEELDQDELEDLYHRQDLVKIENRYPGPGRWKWNENFEKRCPGRKVAKGRNLGKATREARGEHVRRRCRENTRDRKASWEERGIKQRCLRVQRQEEAQANQQQPWQHW